MSDTFVVCAAVKGDSNEARSTAFTELIESFRNGEDKMDVATNQGGVAVLRFPDALKASHGANKILERALAERSRNSPIQPLSLSVERGPDQDVPRLMFSALELAQKVAENNQIVIDHAVYDEMPLLERDTFGAEEEVAKRRVRRRFATGMDACFVISPIGAEGSAERQRADFLFEEYAKRACAGMNLRPRRSDHQFTAEIRRDMLASIARAKLVIAYIASPPWNPNVMIEIGYRLAARGAIIIIRDNEADLDPAKSAKDPGLPFDIGDIQVFSLPPKAQDGDRGTRDRKVGELAQAINEALARIPDPWASHHPFMNIEMDRRAENTLVKQATPEAEDLFAHEGSLVGAEVGGVIDGLRAFMPGGQFNAFQAEQLKLIQALLVPAGSKGSHVTATIPIVFDGHPNKAFDQKAFLPIIVRYEDDRNQNRLTLNVLYLDVTVATRIKEGIFVCGLEVIDPEHTPLLWDNYAISYDRILPRLSMYKKAVERHLQAMSADPIRRILDLGCGSGNVTVPLLAKGKHLTAVDRSVAMLDLLRQKLLGLDDPHVMVLEQSAESLPFPEPRFDGVTILLALFAMDKPLRALKEAIRVLKPGGTLVLTEPKQCFRLQPLLDVAEAELKECGEFEEVESDWQRVNTVNRRIDPAARLRLPAEEIAKYLEKNGFVDIVRQESHEGNCQTISARKLQ